jgi:hypothetical protein
VTGRQWFGGGSACVLSWVLALCHSCRCPFSDRSELYLFFLFFLSLSLVCVDIPIQPLRVVSVYFAQSALLLLFNIISNSSA